MSLILHYLPLLFSNAHLWQWLRENVTYHACYDSKQDLIDAVVLCQLINDELLEYNLDKVRSPKIDAQEIYC